ncbi:hypothetical protein MHBO_001025 [Bonamia ostreae]|uniref:Sushi domain-containing protein n=1 Tax=Bonamia ostreae TaxID=126728 RepID=A0ABV2AHK2_9EUKA
MSIQCLHNPKSNPFVVKCDEKNQFVLADSEKIFSESFYKQHCDAKCVLDDLRAILHPSIDENCGKEYFSEGDSCQVFCANQHTTFNFKSPVKSTIVTCKEDWVYNLNGHENVFEKIKDDQNFACVDNLDCIETLPFIKNADSEKIKYCYNTRNKSTCKIVCRNNYKFYGDHPVCNEGVWNSKTSFCLSKVSPGFAIL